MDRTGDYTLLWYPYEGTDYSRMVPGFKTLNMCRYAGASQTMQHLIDNYGFRQDYSDLESPPWFECGSGCRVEDGQKFVVCEKIEEAHEQAARTPADLSAL